ncbi:hypothetical protein PROFUN_13826 [Planoprotostelium fungivorum]|uniref:Exonuclease domain-containing protein n=1 Tax=Planoprotostelium fungivorum TaxID=1890364 RepID=A0A2P6N2Y5_9EUKA|nr:hypothetical protein PROFUN_13826 [Planoprotostelium fungivorum]
MSDQSSSGVEALTNSTEDAHSEETSSQQSATKKPRQLPSSWTADSQEDALAAYIIEKNAQKSNFVGDGSTIESLEKATLPITTGRIVCFDLETTGFSSQDRIIEIGATEIIDGRKTRVHFRSYCRPTRFQCDANEQGPIFSIHRMAFAAHNLSESFIQREDPSEVVLRDFIDFLFGVKLLVAHNAAFDTRMLLNELNKYSISFEEAPKVFCTQSFFRSIRPGQPYSLGDLANHYDVNINRTVHSALTDAELLANVYVSMLNSDIVKKRLELEDKQVSFVSWRGHLFPPIHHLTQAHFKQPQLHAHALTYEHDATYSDGAKESQRGFMRESVRMNISEDLKNYRQTLNDQALTMRKTTTIQTQFTPPTSPPSAPVSKKLLYSSRSYDLSQNDDLKKALGSTNTPIRQTKKKHAALLSTSRSFAGNDSPNLRGICVSYSFASSPSTSSTTSPSSASPLSASPASTAKAPSQKGFGHSRSMGATSSPKGSFWWLEE